MGGRRGTYYETLFLTRALAWARHYHLSLPSAASNPWYEEELKKRLEAELQTARARREDGGKISPKAKADLELLVNAGLLPANF